MEKHISAGGLSHDEFKRLQNSPVVRNAIERRVRGGYDRLHAGHTGEPGVRDTEEGAAWLFTELCGGGGYPGGQPAAPWPGSQSEAGGGYSGERTGLGAQGRKTEVDLTDPALAVLECVASGEIGGRAAVPEVREAWLRSAGYTGSSDPRIPKFTKFSVFRAASGWAVRLVSRFDREHTHESGINPPFAAVYVPDGSISEFLSSRRRKMLCRMEKHISAGGLSHEEFKRLQNSLVVRDAIERRVRGGCDDLCSRHPGEPGVRDTEEGAAWLFAELCGPAGPADHAGGQPAAPRPAPRRSEAGGEDADKRSHLGGQSRKLVIAAAML